MKYIFCVFFILILFAYSNLQAQQRVINGAVITSGDNWSGNIVVRGDVIVGKKARLTIEPGTQIRFSTEDIKKDGTDKTRVEIIVYGVIIVKGTIENKVLFTSAAGSPQMGDWYGIRIMNAKDVSIIDYSIIEYAYNGITAKKSNPLIRNSQIRLNYNAGISAEVKANPRISQNIISENGYAGIITNLGSKPVLSENLISLNEIGIIAFSLSQPNIGNLKRGDNYNIGKNRLFENSAYDVYNHTNLPLYAENNVWGNNGTTNIAAQIFDQNDEAKYGPIDFYPQLGRQAPVNELPDFLELAQNNPNSDQQDADDSADADSLIQTSTIDTLEIAQSAEEFPEDNRVTNSQVQSVKTEPFGIIPEESERNQNPLASNEKPDIKPEETIDYNQVFLEPFLDKKKEVIRKSVPQVDNALVTSKGRVIVRAVVSKNGTVESASVIKGINAYLNRVTREAALKFMYKPGTINGVPVRFYTNIFFDF